MRDHLSTTFSALADPTRRAILAQLAIEEATVSDLAKPFAKHLSLPAITKHLKVLENAGLIQKEKSAQWRNCSLSIAPLKEASSWIEQYRALWEETLDRLGEYLNEVQANKPVRKQQKGKSLREGVGL